MGIKKNMEAIKSILALNKEAIMATLTNQTISKELLGKGRKACEVLVDADVKIRVRKREK